MTTNPARMPKPAEVQQAMGTVRSFLELNETELTAFYTMDQVYIEAVWQHCQANIHP